MGTYSRFGNFNLERYQSHAYFVGEVMSDNLKAFLIMLGYSEGTASSPATQNDGYDVIVTGVDGHPEIFTDYTDHPFADGRPAKVINHAGLKSSASGKYQFIIRTWRALKDQLSLPDFGPVAQNAAAAELIRQRGAMPDLLAGRLSAAILKCCEEWASLPAGHSGQHQNRYSDLEAVYFNAGGSLG